MSEVISRTRTGKRTVIFHRKGMFYPLELPITDDIAAHAERNPGTLKVTDALTGEIFGFWPSKD